MIRLLLVDDQDLVRAAIRHLLEQEADFEVVADTADGERAFHLAREHEPDVALLDMAMPDTSGVEVTRRLLRACPGVKLLAMSPHEDGPFPACVLELGAAGYITKGCSPRELVKAVRDVGRGNRYVSPEVAQNLILKRTDGNDSRIGMLAPRELEVMLMLSEGRSLREISERLCVSPKTVSTYRTRLMRKLGTNSNVELAHVAFRHGLIAPLPLP